MKFLRLLVCSVLVFSVSACSAPSPEKVCDHMADLEKKAKGDKAKSDADSKKKCVEMIGSMKKEMGDEKWKKFSKCVVGKDDFKAARKDCDPDKL